MTEVLFVVYFVVLLTTLVVKTPTVKGPWLFLLRAFFPNWKFFHAVGHVPQLFARAATLSQAGHSEWSDWALMLARTNWDVPKHRGLSVFLVNLHQPNLDIHRIEMLNGAKEFCQEFMTDLHIPDSDRVGEVDGGWTMKYYRKTAGKVWLEPANKAYPPIHPEHDLKIAAVVKGVIRKY